MKRLLFIICTLCLAAESWGQVHDLASGDNHATSPHDSARYWADRGYFNKSLECLRQLPDDSLTVSDMRLRYDNFANLNNLDSLIFWGDKILKRDPYNISLILDYTPRLNTGKASDMGGRVTYPLKVIDICRKYRERDSTHILVNRQLAEAYYNEGNYDLALPMLKQLEALGDTCFGTLYTLGLTYQRMGDNSTAYDYLSRATTINNDANPYCLFTLGIVCNRIGFGAEALSYLDMAKERMMPDRKTLFRLHRELADAFRMKGEHDLRLEELQECQKLADEKEVNALTYEMGQCYFILKQHQKAEECLRQFLDATENKEYNDRIKQMRQSAEQTLRMMMW